MSHEDWAGGQKDTEPEQADRQHTPGLRPGKAEFKEEICLALIKDKDKKGKTKTNFGFTCKIYFSFSQKNKNFFVLFCMASDQYPI